MALGAGAEDPGRAAAGAAPDPSPGARRPGLPGHFEEVRLGSELFLSNADVWVKSATSFRNGRVTTGSNRAHNSAVECVLHTDEVAGSSPAAPTPIRPPDELIRCVESPARPCRCRQVTASRAAASSRPCDRAGAAGELARRGASGRAVRLARQLGLRATRGASAVMCWGSRRGEARQGAALDAGGAAAGFSFLRFSITLAAARSSLVTGPHLRQRRNRPQRCGVSRDLM